MMISLLGVLLVAGSVGILWYFRPREGRPSPAAALPLMDTIIPLAVTAGLALGVAMVVSGLVS
jgi:hypothetical protein